MPQPNVIMLIHLCKHGEACELPLTRKQAKAIFRAFKVDVSLSDKIIEKAIKL